ncbi:MAG: hypothetical protein BRC26_02500, partial [Nanohaloarchaea archaeon QH_8_44_6]
WKERREERFKKLEEAAVTKGVAQEKFKENFKPEDALWTPVRLREKVPTVEYRGLDISTPSEIKKYVKELKTAIQETEEKDLPEFEKVRKTSERAIEKGITPQVKRYLKGFRFSEDYSPITEKINEGKSMDRKEAWKIRVDMAKKMRKEVT